MKKKVLLFGSIVLVGGAIAAYFFYPKAPEPEPIPEIEINPPFLEADHVWADSVLMSMSPKEKIGQLFMVESNAGYIEHEDSLNAWIGTYFIGGVHFRSSYIMDRVLLQQQCVDTTKIPMLFHADQPTDAVEWPKALARFAISDSALLAEYDKMRLQSITKSGLHLDFMNQNSVPDSMLGWHPFLTDSLRVMSEQSRWVDTLHKELILAGSGPFSAFYDFRQDTLGYRDSLLFRYRNLTENGLSAILLDSIRWPIAEDKIHEDRFPAWMANYLNFKGLILSRSQPEGPYENQYLNALHAGADMVLVPDTLVRRTIKKAQEIFLSEGWNDDAINRRVKKVLLAKSWARHLPDSLEEGKIKDLYAGKTREALGRRMHEASITILRDDKGLLPLTNIYNDSSVQIIHVGSRRPRSFNKVMPYYFKHRNQTFKYSSKRNFGTVSRFRKKTPVIVVHLYDAPLIDSVHHEFITSLKEVQEQTKLVVVNYGAVNNVKLLDSIGTIIQVWENAEPLAGMTTNLMFGGTRASGKSPLQLDSTIAYQAGIPIKNTTRLAYNCMPEEVGLSSDTLKRIDYIVNTVISRKATPGCQVFVARKGKVIFHKSYGHHTYSRQRAVQWDDLYDVASVTKVAATTMMTMQMYELGKFQLDDSLRHYLPDSLLYTSLNNMTFRQILIHKTGLSSGMNILKFLRYQNDTVGRYDKYFCDYNDENYCVKIADGFWMDTVYADSIWVDLSSQWVGPDKGYKYSDANFNLMYFMLQSMNKHKRPFNYHLKHTLYEPMGLQRMTFLPADTFGLSHIVPTENERYWRRQLIHGYVHDPTAALMGGVAGNAGLFSNAADMGALFQMLLQKGMYGGKRYFKPETVDLFTRKQANSHRGLGFNKPTGNGGIIAPDASLKSFGHTGFTGACVWVDPESELVYVFLSNRVHPDANNKKLVQNGTRKRIHQTIYDAMMDKKVEAIVDTLPPAL